MAADPVVASEPGRSRDNGRWIFLPVVCTLGEPSDSVSSSRPSDLPDFRKPPLAEVVLSLQFQALLGLTTAHVGLLWQRYRDRLPEIEERAPLPPVTEGFALPSPPRAEVSFEDKPPTPRVWFVNEEKTELLQVQQDRFIHNWRKVGEGDAYPRYERIRDRFREEVLAFEEFLKAEHLGELAVNQCEVTYVNHVERAGEWQHHGEIERVLKNWTPLPAPAFLPVPEDATLRWRYRITGENGPVGRLYVAVQPSWSVADKRPVWVMNLMARGAPIGPGIRGAFEFFDLGREWVVRGFADLTTDSLQHRWERVDAKSG